MDDHLREEIDRLSRRATKVVQGSTLMKALFIGILARSNEAFLTYVQELMAQGGLEGHLHLVRPYSYHLRISKDSGWWWDIELDSVNKDWMFSLHLFEGGALKTTTFFVPSLKEGFAVVKAQPLT